MSYLGPVATFGNKFIQVKGSKNKDLKIIANEVKPAPVMTVNQEALNEISPPLTPKRIKKIQIFQAKYCRQKLKEIFVAWKRDTLLDPV